MNTKELAFEKMNEELSTPHHQALDVLHNLICQAGDEEIFAGLVKDGKNLKGAHQSMYDYAKRNQNQGAYGMDDVLALSIIRDYLNDTKATPNVESPKTEQKESSYKLPKNVTGAGVVDAPKPKKTKEAKEDVNMSIFDFMGEEPSDESEDPED